MIDYCVVAVVAFLSCFFSLYIYIYIYIYLLSIFLCAVHGV